MTTRASARRHLLIKEWRDDDPSMTRRKTRFTVDFGLWVSGSCRSFHVVSPAHDRDMLSLFTLRSSRGT